MILRTTKKTVIFANSFTLGDFDEVLPPGPYDVETDEELLEGLSFHAYRRTLTLIRLPAKPGHPGLSRTLTIDPNELDAALKRDAASGMASPKPAPLQEPAKGTPEPRDAETDRRAVDRAEDEGMIIHPHQEMPHAHADKKDRRDVDAPLPAERLRGGAAGRRVQRGIGE